MRPPGKISVSTILSKFFLFLLIFFGGCSSKENEGIKNHIAVKDLSKDEKEWISKFLEKYFLDFSAIYTLFGTKPMSSITLNTSTELEWLEDIAPQIELLSEREKNKARKEIQDYCQNNDLHHYWEKWMAWKAGYPRSLFLFRKQPTSIKNLDTAYVINFQEVITTLHAHYPTFSRYLGMEFDPIEVTQDFENPDSIFWEKVLQNHFLQGILYGFGEKNAYLFSKQLNLGEISESDLLFVSQLSEEDTGSKKIKLPVFRSYYGFQEEDPFIEKYKQERKLIVKRLKGKNFLTEALNQMF